VTSRTPVRSTVLVEDTIVPVELTTGASGQLALLAVLSSSVGLRPLGWLVGGGYVALVLSLLAVALRKSWTLGPANRVTLVRAVLVGGVTALVADSLLHQVPTPAIVTMAAIALALDAVDGYVARRTESAGPIGARFDMEVDAFLILVLSVFVAGSLGAWVLAIGAMRYAFVAAGWVLPWLRARLPTSFARKTVAAVQGIVLTAAAGDVLPVPYAISVVAIALGLLVWSFGRDVRWLWCKRRANGEDSGE
jgi:phosphatidylglycerophosphate synthase